MFNPHLSSQSSETPGEALIKTLPSLDHSSDLDSAKSRQKRNQLNLAYLLTLLLVLTRFATLHLQVGTSCIGSLLNIYSLFSVEENDKTHINKLTASS